MIDWHSVLHLAAWTVGGRFVLNSWAAFFALSLGWEALEVTLPFQFAGETWSNKAADVMIGGVGFWAGLRWRSRAAGDGSGGSATEEGEAPPGRGAKRI